jgi:hypothetical protein
VGVADFWLAKLVDGRLLLGLHWYDNEVGYTNSLVEHVEAAVADRRRRPPRRQSESMSCPMLSRPLTR